MSRQTHIFATRLDLENGIRRLEASQRLRYVLMGMFDSPLLTMYSSLLDYAALGINRTGSHITGEHFLVINSDYEVRVKVAAQRSGGTKFVISQLENPQSIVFLPGGLYQESNLVCGHIGTASSDEASVNLYKSFCREITKGFSQIKEYKVGPEALSLMRQGVRMVTIGIRSPEEYDLKVS